MCLWHLLNKDKRPQLSKAEREGGWGGEGGKFKNFVMLTTTNRLFYVKLIF